LKSVIKIVAAREGLKVNMTAIVESGRAGIFRTAETEVKELEDEFVHALSKKFYFRQIKIESKEQRAG